MSIDISKKGCVRHQCFLENAVSCFYLFNDCSQKYVHSDIFYIFFAYISLEEADNGLTNGKDPKKVTKRLRGEYK